jgi:hypothetical protein
MTNQGKLACFFAILAVFCFLSSRPYELIAAPLPPQYPVSRPTMPPMPRGAERIKGEPED